MRAPILLIVGLLALASLPDTRARADEGVTDKVKDSATDTKRDVRKGVRKVKRKFRKAAGTDTVGKDVKDKVHDVGDDLDAASQKTERKLKE